MDKLNPDVDFYIPPKAPHWEPGDTNPFGGPRTEEQTVKFGADEKEFFRAFSEWDCLYNIEENFKQQGHLGTL